MRGDPATQGAGVAVQARCHRRWSHVVLEGELGMADGLDRGGQEGAKDETCEFHDHVSGYRTTGKAIRGSAWGKGAH